MSSKKQRAHMAKQLGNNTDALMREIERLNSELAKANMRADHMERERIAREKTELHNASLLQTIDSQERLIRNLRDINTELERKLMVERYVAQGERTKQS